MVLAFAMVLLLAGCAASADPAQVTERQIEGMKRDVMDGCLKQGGRRGIGDEQVAKVCSCIMNVYDESDWRQAVYLEAVGKDTGLTGLNATLLKRQGRFLTCVEGRS
jgi:hypothetical protein